MSNWSYVLIESNEPKQALERIKSVFDPKGKTEIIEEELIRVEGEELYPNNKNKENEDKLKDLADSIDRLMFISGSDTSDTIYAELFRVEKDSITKIDTEQSAWLIGEDYQCNSYLPAYFYRKHGFKMTDRYVDRIDYESLYNPEKDNSKLICPICGSRSIKINGWKAKCKQCSYTRSKPWFTDNHKFKELAKHPRKDRSPSYDSEWRNLLVKAKLAVTRSIFRVS